MFAAVHVNVHCKFHGSTIPVQCHASTTVHVAQRTPGTLWLYAMCTGYMQPIL